MPEICIGSVEYSFHNDIPVINIFGRDREGNVHRVDVIDYKPYFYALASQSALVPSNLVVDPGVYKSIKNDNLIKIITKKPSDIRDYRDRFTHFESDILYTQKFLIDSQIKSGISYTESPCTLEDLKPIEFNTPARVCILDIECSDQNGFPDSLKDPIFCISCYDTFTKKYITFVVATSSINETPKENGCFDPARHDLLAYEDEKSLLMDFCEYIKSTDFDIVSGWNSSDFDVPYILGRMTALGIPRDAWARLHTGNTDRVEIKGRQLFDLLAGYKRMHLGEQPSYRLDAIAAAELGKQKVRFPGKVYDLWKDDPTNLVFYNFTDVELCVGINEKDETIEFHRHLAQYIGCPIEKTTNSMPLIDVLVLRKAKENGFVLPSKITSINNAESFTGATVIAPLKGVRENVVVLDLKSLYPMTMMTINASPETKDPNGELHAPNGVRFKKYPDGLVRKIQADFLRERDELKKERNKYEFNSHEYKLLNMKQDVIKVCMNSYYGVSANPMFRLNDRDVGAAITSVGRAILDHNKKLIEGEGFKIAQGDTDGLSIVIPKSIGREGTMIIAKELEKILNDSYPIFAKEVLNADVSYFSVKFEKLYQRFFSGGKKKRYAGLLVWKEGVDAHKIDIVGFETKRSDSPQVTRAAMEQLIGMILEGKPYEEIRTTISEIVRKYRKGEYSLDEIGIPGGIGKALEEYDIPDAQVRAAKYANEYLGTNFGKGSKPKRLYIKSVPAGYPRTDVVCFEYADQIPAGFIIDRDTMLKKSLEDPLSRILDALGWQWSSFDPSIKTLSEFGI
ncbi:MAG: DNA-directed DNA polymerase [Tissierellia bacterium]|nr:DNA-directed DNA polymerase [Tissierellia bacterium]